MCDLFLITEAQPGDRLTGEVAMYKEEKAYCDRRWYVPGGCGRLEKDAGF